VHFCNWIAERVTKKYPKVKLGFLAYVQYTRPPKREKLHPALVPQLAPITYCRVHTYLDKNCPSRPMIVPSLQGWGKASKNLAMYEYAYHLAEVSAPFPAIARNVTELPMQYAAGVTMWTPENITNFDSTFIGQYLGIRMTWYPKADPQQILDELYTKFYGAAAAQAKDYWQFVDDCWAKSPEHAGSGFSYARRFTPERMVDMRKRMDAALAACKTPAETRRVKLADENLRQFELFMTMRHNYINGKFAGLAAGCDQWMSRQVALGNQYKENLTFSATGWTPKTLAGLYFDAFFAAAYKDADRINREGVLVTPPLTAWRYLADKEKQGEKLGWQKPGFDDAAWKTTDPGRDTWADLGLLDYFGAMWYRTTVKIADLPAGKKVFLWVSSTDGRADVYINGQHIGAQEGYCQPFSFDITAALKANADNQITILGTHLFLNELGTGGLLGPVLVYREK